MKNEPYTLIAILIFAFIIVVMVFGGRKEVVYAMTDGSCLNQMQSCELEPVGTWVNTKYASSAVYFCTCEVEK